MVHSEVGPSAQLSSTRTLAELFAWRVAQTPLAEAYRQYDDAAKRWISMRWRDMSELVARFAAALASQALPHGARIAILLPNGELAVCVDQSALANACVPVPMHALDNPSSIAYILGDSDASLLFAASHAQWQAIVKIGVALPALRQVVVVEKSAASDPGSVNGVPVLSLEEWLPATAPESIGQEMRQPAAQDLAALVYTSGTTGKPKGVMLTHDNVLSNVKAVLQRVAPMTDDVFLSFLPLSHTFERTAGYYLPMAAGCCVAFARSTKLLLKDLQAVRPTILNSVPRIYERVLSGVEAALAESAVKSMLFQWAQAVGWRRFARAQGSSVGVVQTALDELVWPLLQRLVARPIQNQFGGRIRLAVSGGAPLSYSVARCFLSLGVPIQQGYGMTETSPVVAVNAPEDNDPTTVGRALAGVEVHIGENQELLVRGPNVMRGYWKREEDTARSFVGGWLRTGDQASIQNGRIRILGRVKEIIVSSTGEKIAPADLELAIMADSCFEEAYAFGDNRPYIACAVVLSPVYWDRLAADLKLDPKDPGSLQSSAARAAVLRRLRDLTASFPYYAQPRGVILTLEPWTIENALMTPTLKLKRNNLAAHFAQEIEQVYKG